MAVVIDEMHVEVKENPAPPSTVPDAKPEKPVDLRGTLEIISERKLRLQAD